MSWITDTFTAGTEAAGTVTPNHCGPTDMVITRLLQLYQADAMLAAVFKKIERHDIRPFWDFSDLPKLQLYPINTDSTQEPTQLRESVVSVYCGIRYDMMSMMSPKNDWEPGIITLVDRCMMIAHKNVKLNTVIVGGPANGVSLTRNVRAAVSDPIQDVDEKRGRRALTAEFNLEYEVGIDINTGQIKEVANVYTP